MLKHADDLQKEDIATLRFKFANRTLSCTIELRLPSPELNLKDFRSSRLDYFHLCISRKSKFGWKCSYMRPWDFSGKTSAGALAQLSSSEFCNGDEFQKIHEC